MHDETIAANGSEFRPNFLRDLPAVNVFGNAGDLESGQTQILKCKLRRQSRGRRSDALAGPAGSDPVTYIGQSICNDNVIDADRAEKCAIPVPNIPNGKCDLLAQVFALKSMKLAASSHV